MHTQTTSDSALLRTVRLTPYRKGKGPTFTLKTWDTFRRDNLGKSVLCYEFTQRDADGAKTVLFSGEDFACSPLLAIDSDAACASLLGFLTLRPGDTDAEYFENYTDAQREFAATHAEMLACEVMARFGDQ
jgi:hypothetical protein